MFTSEKTSRDKKLIIKNIGGSIKNKNRTKETENQGIKGESIKPELSLLSL